MRVRSIVLIIAAAAILAAPLVLFAQAGGGNCDGTGPHGPHGGQGRFGGPGGPAGHGLLRMLPRLAERLDLTQGQQDQIQAIIDAQKPALDDLRDQAATARDAFHDTYGIGDFNETAYRAFFEAQAQLHVEMQLIGANTVSQVWDVLTPEQQQQFLDLLELFRDGRGGPRHGGGKRRGPQ
jgi:Spy/CpxP family protein refolding chaperone